MTEQKKPEPGQWLIANDDDTKVFLIGKNSEGQWVIEWEDGTSSVDSGLEDWHHEPDCTGWDWQPPDWVTQDRVPARPGIDQRRWVCEDGTLGHADDDWDDSEILAMMHGEKAVHGYKSNNRTLELRCLLKDLPELPKVEPQPVRPTTDPGEGYRWLSAEEIVQATDEVYRADQSQCWLKPFSRAGYRVNHFDNDDYPVRRRVDSVMPPQPSPLRIFATVDGILYCDTKPRTPLHKQVQFSSCGCFVVEVGE